MVEWSIIHLSRQLVFYIKIHMVTMFSRIQILLYVPFFDKFSLLPFLPFLPFMSVTNDLELSCVCRLPITKILQNKNWQIFKPLVVFTPFLCCWEAEFVLYGSLLDVKLDDVTMLSACALQRFHRNMVLITTGNYTGMVPA